MFRPVLSPVFFLLIGSTAFGLRGILAVAFFVAVRNGNDLHLDIVRHGNEEVLRARFADAAFFYEADTSKSLEDYLPRLDTLTFQEKLGSENSG